VSDSLGPIAIPDPHVIGDFPLTGEYASGFDWTPPIAIHTFDQPGLNQEQRYLLGNGARRFRVVRSRGLACNEYNALKVHFQQAQGQYAQFNYTHQFPGGSEVVVCRYENPSITFDHLYAMLCNDPGITLIEVSTTTANYTFSASQRVTRFPDATLTPALQAQVQEFIPLVKISPRTPVPTASVPSPVAPDPLYLSNRRVTMNGQLFLPRLLEWSAITQTLNEASDAVTFTFGNSDDVWTQYANLINLYRATVEFKLFHVNSNYLIDFWAGYARPWNLTSDGRFIIQCSDGVFELGIPYPSRTVSRTCWKVYKGRFCPSTASFPDCPKDYDACVARGVKGSFGGIVALPASVRLKDNSTGVFGFGRSRITSVTLTNESVYQRPIQEIWSDHEMPVVCDVAAGREESEFYSALGIVSEGPIAGYATNLLKHKLDDQPPHDPVHNGGFRGINGNDPANLTTEYFQLSSSPWGAVPAQSTYAAGVAFAEVRRTDDAGMQLKQVVDRHMTVTVVGGMYGWSWNADKTRNWQQRLSNPVWIAINVFLRGLGEKVTNDIIGTIPANEMENYFDLDAALAAAAICEEIVPSMIVPTQNESQFKFRGVLKEQKPLKDWIQEILNCCCGYYTFVNGKLWIGIRENAAVLTGQGFTRDTILYQSLQATPMAPQFNWLDGQFGDEEFAADQTQTGSGWALNTISVYDIDQAIFAGNGAAPMYTRNQMSFVGVSTKSQAARILVARLREELGGWGPTEPQNTRNMQFRTTLLAMQTKCGDIIGVQHSRLPAGASAYQKGRVQRWTLNPDFSIDIVCSGVTDSMYDFTAGPKPADVPTDPVIPEHLPSINGLAWMPNRIGPVAGDPVYTDAMERSFDLWQDYNITREGVWAPSIFVSGEMVINTFPAQVQPRILGATLVPGGTLNGPMTIYVAVGQHGPAGYTIPSLPIALWIPAGVTGQGVHLDMTPATSGSWDTWDLYAGTDRRLIGWQQSTVAPLPTSTTFNGPVHPMTHELPEQSARKVRIQAKHVWHSGVAGVVVTGVAANTIQSNDFIGSTDNWNNRILTAVADASDGSAPLWNFKVIGFNSSAGSFTVTPDPMAGDPLQPGDVLIARSQPTSWDAGGTWVEDSLWNNSVGYAQSGFRPGWAGLDPGVEVGNIFRIIRGKGAGQFRAITANTNIRITVNPPLDTPPDNTSLCIVEARDWVYFTETTDTSVMAPGVSFELRLRIENLQNMVALVGGFLVDDQGRITDEESACMREIFIFAEPPGVREIGPSANDPDVSGSTFWLARVTDQTIRVDCSTNDVPVHLLALADYQGRALYIANVKGTHNVIITPQAGDPLWDAATTITLGPLESVTITAAGD
jgi:hypothetical protein